LELFASATVNFWHSRDADLTQTLQRSSRQIEDFRLESASPSPDYAKGMPLDFLMLVDSGIAPRRSPGEIRGFDFLIALL